MKNVFKNRDFIQFLSIFPGRPHGVFLSFSLGRGSIPFRGRNDESEPSSDDLAQKRVQKMGKILDKRVTLAVHK